MSITFVVSCPPFCMDFLLVRPSGQRLRGQKRHHRTGKSSAHSQKACMHGSQPRLKIRSEKQHWSPRNAMQARLMRSQSDRIYSSDVFSLSFCTSPQSSSNDRSSYSMSTENERRSDPISAEIQQESIDKAYIVRAVFRYVLTFILICLTAQDIGVPTLGAGRGHVGPLNLVGQKSSKMGRRCNLGLV